MLHRNTLFALACIIPISLFVQEAFGWDLKPSSGGWGSDQVKGHCPQLSGKVEIPGDNGRTADVTLQGNCNFTIPEVSDLPCDIHLAYTLPAAPAFTPVDDGDGGYYYQQDWTAICSDKGLMVEGLLTCDDGNGFAFKDALGIAGPNGHDINKSLCDKVFGSPNAPVFSAQITYASPDNESAVVELSPVTTWDCCHADIADSLDGTGGTATCKEGQDIQVCFGDGLNTTRAYCTYNDPYNTSCGGPNSGKMTVDLYADIPFGGAPDPEAVSINLDVVNLASFLLNGNMPSGECTRKTLDTGDDVIECKFERCGGNAEFIGVADDGLAHLTADRYSGTPIECVNQLQLIE